jgi:ATP-dependent protease HslVU (ClpYQ) peptidase subunit
MRQAGLLALALCLPAFGQINGDGTIIVINSSKEETVFAADSRISVGDSYSDDLCKIRALGDKVVFVVAGRSTVMNSGTHKYLLNAFTMAREAYGVVVRRGIRSHLAEAVADQWAPAEKERLEEELMLDRNAALSGVPSNGQMASAAFANYESDGSLCFRIEQFTYIGGSSVDVTPRAALGWPMFLGQGDVIDKMSQRDF